MDIKPPYYWFQTSVEKKTIQKIVPPPRFRKNSGRLPLESPSFGVTTRRERRRYLDPHFFIMFHLNFGMGPNVGVFHSWFPVDGSEIGYTHQLIWVEYPVVY